ncbi:MAG: N-acetyltransferase [Acidimicrobiales bacterium]|nr:N-acetyltransferase [Acidimicrobiales bacterium]
MVTIRLAELADAEAIRQIYNHYVENTKVTFDLVPRSIEQQETWISERAGALAVIVAVEQLADGDETVLGFASLSPYKDRPAYRTTVEDSVYVAPGHSGKGVGGLLMRHLVKVASDHGYHAMMARIAEGSASSVGVHSAVGFQIVGVEKEVGRKFGQWLDVTVMQKLL